MEGQGLVVFLTRESVDADRVTSRLNIEYMVRSARLIGSLLALRRPLSIAMRRSEIHLREANLRASQLVVCSMRMARGGRQYSLLHHHHSPPPHEKNEDCACACTNAYACGGYYCDGCVRGAHGLRTYRQKLSTVPLQVKPFSRPMNLYQVGFSFVAVLLTFGTLAGTDWLVVRYHRPNPQHHNPHNHTHTHTQHTHTHTPTAASKFRFANPSSAGWVDAVYFLPAAPAAQPRNMILGQLVAILSAYSTQELMAYLRNIYTNIYTNANTNTTDPWAMDVWGPALNIAVTVALNAALGIGTPPAAALAYAFMFHSHTRSSSYNGDGDGAGAGDERWVLLGLQMSCYVIIIVMAATINNVNSARQYPTVWWR